MKDKKKLSIMIIVSIFVFFVIPLTYALFKGIINSSAAMNAASYSVTLNQTQEDSYISVVAGDNTSSASYTVNITSTSEVDIIYSIIVDNVPSGVTVSLDNGSFTLPTNNKVIFANVSTINYSDVNKTKSHTLTFKAAASAATLNDEEIDVDVIARQRL